MEYFSEIIGLLIVVLVLLFPFLRQIFMVRYRKKHPELYQKELERQRQEQQELKEYLESIRVDEEEELEPECIAPPPVPIPVTQPQVISKKTPSKHPKKRGHLQQMVIHYEIFNTPKSLQ